MYHCIDCQVCVEGYDHHCMMYGKCIAKGNLPYFYVTVVLYTINLVAMITGYVLTH